MPFFAGDLPKAVNYGAIGTIMGHELTHGFDNYGVEWDAYGEKKRWMDEKLFQGFLDMAQCVVDQYDNVCFPDLDPSVPSTTHNNTDQCPTSDKYCKCINGTTTEGENIADNGGTMAAYRGYQAFIAKNGSEPRLPGILSKYTMEQIFWISFGRNWCMNTTNSGLSDSIQTDNHFPDHTRALEIPKNIPSFSKNSNHPSFTNMANAVINMLTPTSCDDDYALSNIYMNSVDTEWINDENPVQIVHRRMGHENFLPPIDEINTTAQILNTVFDGFEWRNFSIRQISDRLC